MTAGDWPEVREIYAEGIATGHATFEDRAPQWKEWDACHLSVCRLVLRSDGEIAGWAALSPVSARKVYRGVAEVSVYVAGSARGKGLGSVLLEALVRESEAVAIWTLQASIFPENEASLRMHRKFGFRVVGRRERIAQMNGVWRDTLLLERRSPVAD